MRGAHIGLSRARAFSIALAIAWLGGFSSAALAQGNVAPPAYRDVSLSFEARAADLVGRMTLEEKAAQLLNDAPAIPRLGVREYNWWNEGLHGVAGAGRAAVFPQAIGMAATFDAPLLREVGGVVGIEFRAKHLADRHRFGGSDWFGGLTVWSPNINIFRDPRWGRGQETYGEDPYLTARLGVAYVRGLQGEDGRYLQVVSTPKHFAVHSGPEPSRHRDDIRPSTHDLEDTYLPAFRAAVMEGQAGSVMCAYNAVNGEPACANQDLLVTHLREGWGFKGYVVSDCGAVSDIYREDLHHFAQSPEAGAAIALQTGMDLICGDAHEAEHILGAVRQGLLGESVIDGALRRLFAARMRLGQFDPPERVFPRITARDYDTEAHRVLALRVAEASLVLLKNEGELLPLRAPPRTIAVIGPNGDSLDALVGNYSGEPSQPATVLAGLRRRFPEARILYAQGAGLIAPALRPVPDDVFCLDARCRRRGLMAADFDTQAMSGAPRTSQVAPNAAMAWQGELRGGATRWSGFLTARESGEHHFRFDGNGGYRIWVGDTQVVDAWRVDWRAPIAVGAVSLEAGRTYPIRIEAFQRRDHGEERLLWSTPSDQGAQDALAAAAEADLVVFVAGLSARIEGEEMRISAPGFLGGDRTSLDLPAVQQRLLERVAAVGKPMVLVLMSGSALGVNWADAHAPAIIEAWYPGGQGGDAVARLIAGDFSPAGRLPVTFYKSADDLPAFEDYAMAKRTYRYFGGEALYPFGYGLSYTRFAYSNARVSQRRVRADGAVTVSVDVANIGAMDGDEVVQLYATHPGAAGAPLRALAGFQRIHLAHGERRSVQFTLRDRELSVVDPGGVRRISPGEVRVWVGGGQPVARAGLQAAPGVWTGFEITSAARLGN
ncbi:MAG: glycoside hydrolase family 3 C-terminal domain-containing protein [Hyphomonadaceae bacterium]|nr:glycoside hydrolase family 3 C-terminal domain-containing protein [Hyphomonadaceae bacterium]